MNKKALQSENKSSTKWIKQWIKKWNESEKSEQKVKKPLKSEEEKKLYKSENQQWERIRKYHAMSVSSQWEVIMLYDTWKYTLYIHLKIMS